MRVVIAEDNVLLAAGLNLLLDSKGIEVAATVADRPAFVAAVDEHQPDITIVDVRLPPPTGKRASRPRSKPAEHTPNCRSSCFPSMSSSSTPANCSPTVAAASAICSRTGSAG